MNIISGKANKSAKETIPFGKRRNFVIGALKGKGGVQVTLKGLAFLCAIDAGMVREIPGGYDEKPFIRFWDEFSKFIQADQNGYPNEVQGVAELLQREKGE